jgi:23S rRNA U2552 (ribose-2'-O)-methylase RlmE/FtsJ
MPWKLFALLSIVAPHMKLVQIHMDMSTTLRLVHSVVDVGAAPGGWTELAVEWVGERGKVVGVDLLPIDPLAGAELLEGDFTDDAVREEILRIVGGRIGEFGVRPSAPVTLRVSPSRCEGRDSESVEASVVATDVVLSDMAPSFSGDHMTDHLRTNTLCNEVKREGLRLL